MSQFVLESLYDQENAIVEAGTGIGKTMGYLVPAIVYAVENDKKITVTTETKALQKQLLEKDLPYIKLLTEKYLDFDFSFSLCLGSANYPCLTRIESVRIHGRFGPEDLTRIVSLKKSVLDGEAVTRFDVTLPEYLWSEINRESDGCMSYRCPFNFKCPYQSARREWEESRVLVMNHYLFFTNIAYDKTYLPQTEIVIFDEAHSIEDIAAKQIGYSISNSQLVKILNRLYSEKSRHSLLDSISDKRKQGTSIRLVKEIEKEGNRLFKQFSSLMNPEQLALRLREPVREKFEIVNSVRELIMILADCEDDFLHDEFMRVEFDIARGRLFVFNENLKDFLYHNNQDYVYWIEREPKKNTGDYYLKGQPISIEELFSREVIQFYESSVFTSATLSVNNDMSYLVTRLGIMEYRSLVLQSTFDYKSQVILYTNKNSNDPSGDSYIQESVNIAESIIDMCGGNCLFLFTSYAMLGQVRGLLEQAVDYTIFSQDRLSASDALQAFIDSENTVLMGTHSFWQGIDLPGDLLRGLVMMRLPFSVPNLPHIEARIERIAEKGLNPFYQYQLPEAIIRFKQGFGRLIRSKKDRGIIAVIDSRINTKSYGRFFLNSVPQCTLVHSLQELKELYSALIMT